MSEGFYDIWPKRCKVMENAVWYRMDQLSSCLKSIRTVNFSIVEQRQQALERLNGLATHEPVGEFLRFDDDYLYVCEFAGDWARKIQQIKSSLSYKDKDLKMMSSFKDEKRGEDKHDMLSDSSQAFWNATTSVYDQLIRLEHVYDRDTFEEEHNLDWISEEEEVNPFAEKAGKQKKQDMKRKLAKIKEQRSSSKEEDVSEHPLIKSGESE